MKWIFLLFPSSIFLLIVSARPVRAQCVPKEFDPGSGTYGCVPGFNEPCSTADNGYCCKSLSQCSSLTPTPVPTDRCTSPLPPDFTTCPATHSITCYLPPNDYGISDLTCCATQAQCNNFTTPVPPSSPLTPYDPTCGPGESGVKTALGCLPTNPQAFVNTALPWAIGIGAGLAFLLGIYGALMIVISAGNPEKMQAGRELITSAISGLLIIIFAIFLLKVIGVDILNLFPEATRTGGGGGGRPPVAM